MKRKLIYLIISFFYFLVSNSYANYYTLEKIRFGDKNKGTRVVLDIDKSIPFKIFTLKSPYRLVIDTPNFNSNFKEDVDSVKSKLIKKIRNGIFKEGVGRFVFDLKYNTNIKKVFVIDGKNNKGKRLIIDLQKVSKTTKVSRFETKSWKQYLDKIDFYNRQNNTLDDVTSKNKKIENKEKKYVNNKKKKKFLVVIDAGHGGIDPGGVVGRTKEKHITLAIAKELKKTIDSTRTMRAVLTRKRDVFIKLRDRYRIAEKLNADLFVSIHVDKHRNRKVRGMSIYTLSEKSSDKEAARLAKKENSVDVLAGEDLNIKDEQIRSILIDMQQRLIKEDSSILSQFIVSKMKEDGNVRLLRNAHRFAGFAVLKSVKMPGILVETGYMTNRYDLKNLKSKKWQKKMTKSMTKALLKYFDEQYK